MANAIFNIFKKDVMDGTVDLDTNTLKALLVMTNTTADTEIDIDTVSALTTLDEMDGAGYTGGHGGADRLTLANVSVTVDDTDDEGVFDNTVDLTWTSISNGTRSVQGCLIIKEGAADDTTAIPIVYLDFAAPITPGGGNIVEQFAAEGILNLN